MRECLTKHIRLLNEWVALHYSNVQMIQHHIAADFRYLLLLVYWYAVLPDKEFRCLFCYVHLFSIYKHCSCHYGRYALGHPWGWARCKDYQLKFCGLYYAGVELDDDSGFLTLKYGPGQLGPLCAAMVEVRGFLWLTSSKAQGREGGSWSCLSTALKLSILLELLLDMGNWALCTENICIS